MEEEEKVDVELEAMASAMVASAVEGVEFGRRTRGRGELLSGRARGDGVIPTCLCVVRGGERGTFACHAGVVPLSSLLLNLVRLYDTLESTQNLVLLLRGAQHTPWLTLYT
jgi:hypothetical protein